MPKDPAEATRLLGAAARAGNLDAEVEYAILLFNGTGIAKDEAGAVAWFRKAARKGSPIAQNRLARILAAGRGVPADAVAATKWHLIAKAAGEAKKCFDRAMKWWQARDELPAQQDQELAAFREEAAALMGRR